MKKISVIIGSILLAGMGVFSSCNTNTKDAAPASSTAATPSAGVTGKIAYVNVDTLETRYELLKTKREEFKQRQEQMENELQRSYDQMQSDAEQVQKKAQANTLTQSEYEAAQKRLGQMQRSLETRKQALTEQLIKEQNEFNQDLKTRLDAFLAEYNKTKKYDFILSYSNAGSSILYANKDLDITKDVVDGMNASAKNDANKKK